MAGIDFKYTSPGCEDETRLAAALSALRTSPMDAGALIDHAVALAADSPHQAATLYKTWIALNADHPGLHAIYFNYAVCLADSHDLPAAANALRAAIALKPDFAPPTSISAPPSNASGNPVPPSDPGSPTSTPRPQSRQTP